MNRPRIGPPGSRVVLHPHQWPLRWRLTAVSAGLTFVILVVFALVIGPLTSSRLQHDYDTEVTDAARELAATVRPALEFPATGIDSRRLERLTTAPPALFRVVRQDGSSMGPPGAPDLGPPHAGLSRVSDLEIATTRIFGPGGPRVYVQYARSTESLDATVNRLWLFLGAGVVGGTLLAALGGFLIAGRAMRPITRLTDAARKVAATRDPSRRVPQPEADDEVAELARTLDQMLRELDAARAETNQMMQAQREFVADASHELRTPLTSILANLELLQAQLEAAPRDSDETEMVDGALRSSRRMSRLVSDLLLLARADAGRTGARRECDLAEIGAAALSEARPVAEDHPLELVANDPVPIEGNPDELHRLVLNLLENGLRHTPAGTEISLAVGRRNGDAVLEVSDDGPGLPEGMQEQIFSRFVRGSGPADLSRDSGTGLGLAIVKAVATAHGGDVEAGESAAGGARFTVHLPLAAADAGNGSATARPSPEADRANI